LEYCDSFIGSAGSAATRAGENVLRTIAAFLDVAYERRYQRKAEPLFVDWPRVVRFGGGCGGDAEWLCSGSGLRRQPLDAGGLPQQSNSNDCGVYTCQFGYFAAIGRRPVVRAQEVPLLRQVMALELLEGRVLLRI
jgi:hypothetical protein